jgi:hypothetical protein
MIESYAYCRVSQFAMTARRCLLVDIIAGCFIGAALGGGESVFRIPILSSRLRNSVSVGAGIDPSGLNLMVGPSICMASLWFALFVAYALRIANSCARVRHPKKVTAARTAAEAVISHVLTGGSEVPGSVLLVANFTDAAFAIFSCPYSNSLAFALLKN